jgi:hypothetical protein
MFFYIYLLRYHVIYCVEHDKMLIIQAYIINNFIEIPVFHCIELILSLYRKHLSSVRITKTIIKHYKNVLIHC